MPSGFLTWSVKPSLLEYASRLEDGSVDLVDGANGDLVSGFRFPIVEATSRAPECDGFIRAEGKVILRGHGMVMCEISDPHVEVTGERGVISIRRWPNRDARLEVGMFDSGAYEVSDDGWRWPAVTLLNVGREAFDYRYDEGAGLAPVGIVTP